VAEDWYADVMEFHRAMAPDLIGTMPQVPESAAADLRMALVCEEIVELDRAMERGDLPGVADAVADAVYVLLGLAVTFGIDMRPVWAAVHAANMAKVGGPRRADGKRLKPDGWHRSRSGRRIRKYRSLVRWACTRRLPDIASGRGER
jgi:predicted HAD superfamily Cof-like phosphohydrolase